MISNYTDRVVCKPSYLKKTGLLFQNSEISQSSGAVKFYRIIEFSHADI